MGYSKTGGYWEQNGQPLEVELLVSASAGSPGSPGERQGEFIKQIFAEIQTALAADVPALALYYPNWYYAYNNRANLYFTMQGVGSGVPIPLNKMSFVK
ncbi:hypothetical protein [Sporomusa silvacetica]|uniref:hypothetical protein n=1 Tax=Sporomusa silvacetica TaxID=55504 RepID=UPI00118188FE|nr:hypothetical protein [Sporomusa silvacetica]